jgi:hypothetical protein
MNKGAIYGFVLYRPVTGRLIDGEFEAAIIIEVILIY